jgi:SpoIID/LytB domain protein
MRLSRPFFISFAVLGAFTLAAQFQSHRAAAQFSAGPVVGGKLPDLPAPPSLGGKKTVIVAPQPLSKPTPIWKPTPRPTPTPAPLWKPRFLGQKTIRVGLSTAGESIQIYFPGGATLWNDKTFFSTIPAGTTAILSSQPDKSIVIGLAGQRKMGFQRAYFAVSGDPARVTTNGKSPRYGRPYRGDLEIFPQKLPEPVKRKGPLALVNVVPLEAYLKGVVPWEMAPTAPLEALKAQAICARTKTLDFVQSGRFKAGDFEVCDYDACQGYPGTENEKPTTSAAVEQTRGLAIYQNGRPIDAVYSTNSGGITANARDVWKGTTPINYLQSVPDFPANSPLAQLWEGGMTEGEWAQFCAQDWPSYARPDGVSSTKYEARKYRWSEFISVEAATKAFAAEDGISGITNIQVMERSPSGRIRRLRVTGFSQAVQPSNQTSDGWPPAAQNLMGVEKTIDFEGDGKIRSMFSKRLGSTTALPSSLFTISPVTDANGAPTGWNFQGAGWGHGVGMCQRGAQNHAREGWNARRILNHYYRGVEIR